jgi:hypothetical protein
MARANAPILTPGPMAQPKVSMNNENDIIQELMQAEYPTHFALNAHGLLETAGYRLLITPSGLKVAACNGVHSVITSASTGNTRRGFMPMLKDVTSEKKEICLQGTVAIMTAISILEPYAIDGSKEHMRVVVRRDNGAYEILDPAVSATQARVRFDPNVLAPGDQLIADIHTHPHGFLDFSSEDDHDDMQFSGDLKLSAVLAYCPSRQQLQVAKRFCSRGLLIDYHSLPFAKDEVVG